MQMPQVPAGGKGIGRCGKTRLALKAAEAMATGFAEGVYWVGLESLRDPSLITEYIIQSLGISHQLQELARESLVQFFQSKDALLVLDNCEHLSADCVDFFRQILSQSGPALPGHQPRTPGGPLVKQFYLSKD